MKVYQSLWVTACVTLGLLGLSLGLIFVAVPVTVMVILSAAAAAIVAWARLWHSERTQGSPRAPARVISYHALVAGAAIGATIGFAVFLGAGVVVLLVLILVSSPHAVRACGRWLRSFSAPSSTQLERTAWALSYASPEYLVFPHSSAVEALTDEEVCRSWRASYRALQHRPSATQTAAITAERQTYLDELERRNPCGFAAWLASGATAPGNPLPYLTRGWADDPPIDWDELTRGQDW